MTGTMKTRLGCEALEVRDCPAVLAMDSPDLRVGSHVAQPPAADTRVLVAPTAPVMSALSAKGIIINF